MAKQEINLGTGPNTGTGEPIRSAFQKVNENFTEVYANSAAAFDAANSATSLAQAAFNQANTGGNSFDQDLNTTDDVEFNEITTSNAFIGSIILTANTPISGDESKILSIPNSSGDGQGYTTLHLIPDDTVESFGQYLVLDPTQPQHIHLRAGGPIDDSGAELYLGGEKNYVRVIDYSGVRIQNQTRSDNLSYFVDPADFNTATWYELNGTYFVQFTAITPEIGDLAFDIGNDDENSVIVGYGDAQSNTLTYGGSSSNLGNGVFRFSVDQAPPANNTVLTSMEFEIWSTRTNSLTLQSNDFNVSVTDDIRITGSDGFSLRNESPDEPIEIVTDYNGVEHTWEFGADGTLQTPGDIVVRGDITGTSAASTLVLRAQPDSDTYIQLNNTVDSTISTVANLEIITDASNTAKIWTFVDDGTLLFPDSTFQTTAFTNRPTLDYTITNSLRIEEGVQESYSNLTSATGVVTHNCANGQIFYHTSPSGNFTANFTNLELENGYATSLTLVISQGETGYIANTVLIDNSSTTIKWQGNTEPTPNANSIDVISFSIIKTGFNNGEVIVLGQLSTFG